MSLRSERIGEPAKSAPATAVSPRSIDRAIAQLNIEHFRKLLTQETDEAKRRIVCRLLAEEEAKLAALEKPLKPDEKKV